MSDFLSPARCHMKLQVYNTKPHFGKGVITLLELVRDGHSLRSASLQMEMAYSKAWRLVRDAEADLGMELLSKQKGGMNRSGSTLTPEGELLLSRFHHFEAEAQHIVQDLFDKHFMNDLNAD